MLFWVAVGLVAGKTSTFGIKIPSVFDGLAWFVDRMSSCAFGTVVLMPTCANNVTENKKTVENNSFLIKIDFDFSTALAGIIKLLIFTETENQVLKIN